MQRGVPMEHIMALGGWKSAAMAKRYARVNHSLLASAIAIALIVGVTGLAPFLGGALGDRPPAPVMVAQPRFRSHIFERMPTLAG
jgi:hypothetical protein